MIARKYKQSKKLLSKTTLMTIRNIAKKGSDADLEDFIFDVASYYIAHMKDAEWVDPKDYLKVTGKTWEFECPSCGCRCDLDLASEVDG